MKDTATGEIVADEEACLGCGYCAEFCPRDCITMGNRINSRGYIVPQFVRPEDCTACAVCAWMCPQSVIEVYKYQPA